MMTCDMQPVLINGDALPYIKTLPDDSIDLILTDPPYFRVKSCAWDRQWKTQSDYLAWLDAYLSEFSRVLKPNGSLYMFCGSVLATDTEIMLRQHMNVLNHIIWAKPYGRWTGCSKEALRSYFPSTERILFAEQYEEDSIAGNHSGYASKCAKLRGQVFAPLIYYFINAKNRLGIKGKEIEDYMGSRMHRHWFSYSQWQLPSEAQYERLQKLFLQTAQDKNVISVLSEDHDNLAAPYNELKIDYRALQKSYAELRSQYKSLRRPFSVTKDVPYTDVWNFPPVQSYPGKHPCEKPTALLEHIINASSKPGHTVADFFMGSGSTVKAAMKLGRKSIGIEIETERFEQTRNEILNYLISHSIGIKTCKGCVPAGHAQD